MLSGPVRRQFLRFCAGELAPQVFELWVSEAAGLEEQVGRGTYTDLLSADYRGRDAGGVRELCERLLDSHHPGTLRAYRVARILGSMVQEEAALLPGLRQLVRLHHEGYDFIPVEFVGFDSETDSIPSPRSYHLWDPSALAPVLARSTPYLKQIQQAARDLLEDLRRRYPDDV